MRILSLEYLVFTAATFAAYYLFPLNKRWWVLLAASVAFYSLAGLAETAYLAAVTFVTWSGAFAVHRLNEEGKAKKSRLALGAVLGLTLGAMAVLKYGGAAWEAINRTGSKSGLPAGDWLFPLGLSWFTFQSAGYVIDVFRGKARPEKNPLKYLLFVSFFPQMTQGPISTWRQLSPQLLKGRPMEPERVISGFELMIWGYFKKLVIADRLAAVTAYITSGREQPGWLILLGAATYMVRLYADFSGGMDVIRGTAGLMGIDMQENFRRPFFAQSVGEYWRRWHITLGAWFRSYLLYPLTTSRAGLAAGRAAARLLGKKTGRLVPSALATVLIFFLIGIWHGASWNAAIYGLYFGLMMAGAALAEPSLRAFRRRLGAKDKSPLAAALRLVRTWALILLAQYFAFTSGPRQAFSLLMQSARGWASKGFAQTLAAVMPPLEWGIALGAVALLILVDLAQERGTDVFPRLAAGKALIRWPVMILLILAVAVLGCYGDGFDSAAFLYTQF